MAPRLNNNKLENLSVALIGKCFVFKNKYEAKVFKGFVIQIRRHLCNRSIAMWTRCCSVCPAISEKVVVRLTRLYHRFFGRVRLGTHRATTFFWISCIQLFQLRLLRLNCTHPDRKGACEAKISGYSTNDWHSATWKLAGAQTNNWFVRLDNIFSKFNFRWIFLMVLRCG